MEVNSNKLTLSSNEEDLIDNIAGLLNKLRVINSRQEGHMYGLTGTAREKHNTKVYFTMDN